MISVRLAEYSCLNVDIWMKSFIPYIIRQSWLHHMIYVVNPEHSVSVFAYLWYIFLCFIQKK